MTSMHWLNFRGSGWPPLPPKLSLSLRLSMHDPMLSLSPSLSMHEPLLTADCAPS